MRRPTRAEAWYYAAWVFAAVLILLLASVPHADAASTTKVGATWVCTSSATATRSGSSVVGKAAVTCDGDTTRVTAKACVRNGSGPWSCSSVWPSSTRHTSADRQRSCRPYSGPGVAWTARATLTVTDRNGVHTWTVSQKLTTNCVRPA